MNVVELLVSFKAAACVFAILSVVARLPRVVQRRRPDLVWVGTVFAAVVFSANGVMLSERTLDTWLGGTNVFHLMRNLLALSAIWCLRAALVQSLQRKSWSRSRTLQEAAIGAAVLLALTAAFFTIDRNSTSVSFIPDHLHQGGTLVYTALIMAMGGWNAVDVARVAFQELARRDSTRDRLLRPALWCLGYGSGLLAIGCALETVYATLEHLGTFDPWAETLRLSFGPVFMPGAALVCLSVAWLGLYAQGRRLQIDLRTDLMKVAPIWRQVGADRWSLEERGPGWRSALSADPQRALYTAVIAIEDALRSETVSLTQQQRRALATAERRFELTP